MAGHEPDREDRQDRPRHGQSALWSSGESCSVGDAMLEEAQLLSGAREERFAVAVASLGRAVRERPILWPLDLWDLRSFTGEQQGASILSRSHLTFTGKEEELAMDPELGWGVGLQRNKTFRT
uniref:Uncharacterized protein n=1 Tax=Aegilops tauschii TaxID=37682 RepID=R7W807_AEGTA